MSTPSPEKRKIGIIGAGFGGLVSAVQLAHAGCKVTVFEKNPEPGGRMGGVQSGGFTWDGDPWSIVQPDLLRALWKSLDRNLEDYLTLVPLPVHARYFWQDGTQIDNDKSFRERKEVARYLGFGKGSWELTELFHSLHGERWAELLNPAHLSHLRHLSRLLPGLTMHRASRRFFKDPRLVQLFDQYATRLGSTPFRTPAALCYLPYLEAEFGLWHTQGGTQAVIKALLKVAGELGVEVQTDCEATAVYDSSVAISGKWHNFDAVICNQDVLMAYQALLPRRLCGEFREAYLDRHKTSLSTFTLHLGVKHHYPQLSHHNVFFGKDPKRDFHQLISERTFPEEPTIYLTVSSRTEPGLAPEGCENWTLHVDAPPIRSSTKWEKLAESFGNRLIEQMETRWGFEGLSQKIIARTHVTPYDLRNRFQCFGGCQQGFAPHTLRNTLIGPAMIPPGMSGFFFTGASMRPGGIPSNILRNANDAVHNALRHLKTLPQSAPVKAK